MNSLQKQQHKPNQKFPLRFVRRASWDYGTVVMHEATHFKIGKFLHYTFIKFHYKPFFFLLILLISSFFHRSKGRIIRYKFNVKSIFPLRQDKSPVLYRIYRVGKLAQSEKDFHCDWNLKKNMPDHQPGHLFFRWIQIRVVIWKLSFEIWTKEKKISEIKPPLET